ncbi:MAG: threonine synthase [Spirochaetaceae bacterium]|jgi:threonine synthase|nr:threonine synthase [Spirochaetaceae bacterium]
MVYTDTKDSSVQINFETAVMEGMGMATGGLYVPVEYPRLSPGFLNKQPEPSFRDIALETMRHYAGGEIPEDELVRIIGDSYPFSAPVVPLDKNTYLLELFHGPTCAFKDFGARFMARVMSYFNRGENSPLHILVATSGDTGSAVGSAFHRVPGLDVTILYPRGKISPLQEKQLCTFDGNVRALRVDGTFDDCQRLVKTAFTDKELRKRMRLSSANSINIARLLPQSFYYTYASLVVRNRIPRDSKIENPAIIVAVPSGNFGNVTSGLIARKMGAPIAGFIAATNANKTVPDWIVSGEYRARPSVQTLSNAMDVGAPSNYERIRSMYTLEEVRRLFAGYWLDDEGTIQGIRDCNTRTGYVIDPHGAVAWAAWNDLQGGALERLALALNTGAQWAAGRETPGLAANLPEWTQAVLERRAVGIVLETAHPAKFAETVKKACWREPSLPARLEKVLKLPGLAQDMTADYGDFKHWLTANL